MSKESYLDGLHKEIEACVVCREAGHCIKKTHGIQRGVQSARVMAVGIAPSAAARKAKKAFAGSSFSRLAKWFAAAGFPATETQLRDAIYLTSLNKCAVMPDTPANRRILWTRCQQFLWRQIEAVRPELILILGREPAALILGDRNLRSEVAFGKSWTTTELFAEDLFPATTVPSTWLILPHPSGLSRTMNDKAISGRIISSLGKHLKQVRFSVAETL